MMLRLSIRNPESLAGRGEAEFRLADGDATIGRSKACDWSLPDDKNYISSRHCQISNRADGYYLKDISTNGTLLNGSSERMTGERKIESGDVFLIGQYQVEAALEDRAQGTTAVDATEPTPAKAETAPSFAGSTSTWSRGADGAVSAAQAAPPVAPAPAPPPAPQKEPASRPSGNPADVEDEPSEAFTQFISANDLDWARSGFGGTAAAPAPSDGSDPVEAFMTSAGLQRGDSNLSAVELMARAGGLIRRLVSGMVVMVESRARAKSQMGAESTSLQVEGNNPIKFARTPEAALKQLLNPKERGFMEAERAIEDGYLDLQSHQIATLAAIPGSLKATLERFSPGSIKRRAENMGVLTRVIPAMRDAALWHNYEREFAKVAAESDEAFMEVFSKEFRKYYDKQLQKQQRP
ncbi:MAG TPA: type VI secretion system-associated FHA domain protein TagH [Allosphingosinicella sp.]|jgi:type VI secretion system protein|uniref:type VI secretion system-associated FHA domain protein TagH n=1 Tax=Allosphingosinicella sp. TaxID=2823234 RepID=UPI002F288E3C